MTIEVRWGSASHAGCVRPANQDSVLAGPSIFAIADGMGGHAAGEVASALAVARMAILPADAPGDDILDAVRDANAEVIAHGAPGSGREGMGTTLSGMAVSSQDGHDALLVFNVGDSRTYLLDANGLVQITEDHSLVAEMVRAGEIARAEAGAHRSRNVITRALGIEAEVVVDHWWVEPRPGQVLLACSDGLTNEVSEADIEAVLRSATSPQSAVDQLVERALEAGARDNVSAVVLFVDSVTDGVNVIEEDTNPRGKAVPMPDPSADLIDQVPGNGGPAVDEVSESTELVTGVPSLPDDAGA